MADLTPLDEKLAEVLGLAQAAQVATKKVGQMEGADDHEADLERMHSESAETKRRTDELVGTLEGRKTAIRDLARETKSEATEMMKTYLGDETEALPVQRQHVELVRKASLTLAADEGRDMAG